MWQIRRSWAKRARQTRVSEAPKFPHKPPANSPPRAPSGGIRRGAPLLPLDPDIEPIELPPPLLRDVGVVAYLAFLALAVAAWPSIWLERRAGVLPARDVRFLP